ncbi:DBH-like monooxygenase protein 2 homolog [Brachyistius frenatus]|uniref:DBH-like monooxygenase protein 2 homolog n=1 Tax=Brachyistius frenatus TaxID=100188 RepID=UPI0037E81C0E
MCPLLLFLSLFLSWTKQTLATDPSMPFMEYLDQDHLVCLKWGYDNLQGHITFQLVVNSTGWVSFGLSPNGGMKGSDIVIGGLGPDGIYFTDRHATGNSMPIVDEQQNYTLLSGNENEGQTTITFQRSIQTCDDKDFHITAQPIKLIYAYGTTDEISYHGARRGTKEVNLLNYMPKTNSANAKYLLAKVDNITVPPVSTYYHCKIMKFPKLNTKHHIYQIEPVIENYDVVHHMLLYHCPPFVTEPYDKQCYMGDVGDACFGVAASWGVGGGVYELPENVGIPVGGEVNDVFYRLEIHYNNPHNKTDITDSSGLRLHYTAQLRQHDMGILTTGLISLSKLKLDIPPKAPQFHIYGICNTTHFSELVNPVPNLQVFAVLLHTHLAGRKVRVGHFRNGKQEGFLGLDENYNFEMQQTVNLGNIRTIQQGDEITVECTYNTSNRNEITKFGLGTTDEMCLAFIFYYPAIKIKSCISHPNTTYLSNNRNDKTPGDTSDPDEIAEYETVLKTLPQVQVISSDMKFSIHPDGVIRKMIETPTVACQNLSYSVSGPNGNASSKLCTSWIVNTAGIIVLLIWIAIM